MPNRPAPWTVRARQLLADGTWHPREEIVAACVGLVPPGKAWRHAERDRTRTGPERRHRGDDQTATSAGARGIVVRSLARQVQTGRFEQRTVDGHVELRLPP